MPPAANAPHVRCYARPLPDGTDGVRVAGRVMLLRVISRKLIFLTLQDRSGRLQISLRLPTLPETDLAHLRDTLDLGDFLGVRGVLWTTKTGEKTLDAREAVILKQAGADLVLDLFVDAAREAADELEAGTAGRTGDASRAVWVRFRGASGSGCAQASATHEQPSEPRPRSAPNMPQRRPRLAQRVFAVPLPPPPTKPMMVDIRTFISQRYMV